MHGGRLFGWSYPPGCDSVPGDWDEWCQMCGREVGECVCPECPVCGEVGNPECYSARESRHLSISREQVASLEEVEAEAEDREAAEQRYAEEFRRGIIVETIVGYRCSRCQRSWPDGTKREAIPEFCPDCSLEAELVK